jgi:hypothetical protein
LHLQSCNFYRQRPTSTNFTNLYPVSVLSIKPYKLIARIYSKPAAQHAIRKYNSSKVTNYHARSTAQAFSQIRNEAAPFPSDPGSKQQDDWSARATPIPHLSAHEVFDPEGEVPDGPLAERLRVGEPQRLRERAHRLDPRRRRLRRPPSRAPPTPLPRPSSAASAGGDVLAGQPPAQHEVQHHGRAHRRRHRRRPHGRPTTAAAGSRARAARRGASLYGETFLAGAEMEISRSQGREMGWGLGCFAASADA